MFRQTNPTLPFPFHRQVLSKVFRVRSRYFRENNFVTRCV